MIAVKKGGIRMSIYEMKNCKKSKQNADDANENFRGKDVFKSKQKFLTDFAELRIGFFKRFFVFLVLVCFSSAFVFASSNVMISQVIYDPIKTESGGEAIEIYNPTSASVNISSWIIQTDSSAQDAVLPKNTFINANQFYLITDSGWNLSKDNESWPDADYEDTITLKNADSGFILKNANNEIIDRVGWGNSDSIFFEGSSAVNVAEGQSLIRLSLLDTDNNSFDFIASSPDFRNSKSSISSAADFSQFTQEILLNITVEANPPVIVAVWLNSTDSKISPIAGQKKLIPLVADVSENCNANVFAKLKEKEYLLTKSSTINSTTAEYVSDLEMDYYDEAKNYSVKVYAVCNDTTASEETIISFEYAELTAFQIEQKEINLKTKPGNITQYDIPIRNTGNIALDFKLWSSELLDSMPAVDIEYYFQGNSESSLLTTQPIIEEVGLLPGLNASTELIVKLKIPETSASGNYLGKILIEPAR